MNNTDEICRLKEENDRLLEENDRLLEENDRLWAETVHWELSRCPSCENVAALQLMQAENAHLQSLVRQFYWYTKSMREALRMCKDKNPYYLEVLNDSLAKVYDQMAELRVEED